MAALVFALLGIALVMGVPIGVLVLWQRVRLLMARLELLERRLATIELQATSGGQSKERQPRGPHASPAETTPEVPTGLEPAWLETAEDGPQAVADVQAAPHPLAPPAAAAAIFPTVTAAPSVPPPPSSPTGAAVSWAETRQASLEAHTASSIPSASSDHSDRSEWELVLGTSWLNKIGVLVLVLGLGFLLAYSFARLGPAGRIGVGYALSAALLGGGIALARRRPYIVYGQGLIAGGWAAMYLTTFAAHGIASARVIESDLVGVLGLLTVATGMIAHSLNFRSLPMAALAYIVAYATLAQTPLSGFSLAATLPLTASLLVVAVRAQWTALSLLGLALTFGLFAVREQLFAASALDPDDAARYAALGLFWLLFEISDHFHRRPRSALGVSNVAGVLGAVLLRPPSNPRTLGIILVVLAVGLIGSALARLRREAHRAAADGAPADTLTSAHTSTGLAAGLFAWASFALFAPTQAVVGLFLDAEWLIAAGLALRQRPLRALGVGMAVVASASAWSLVSYSALRASDTPPTLVGASMVALLGAALWYANDTWIRRSGTQPLAAERLYSWAAFALFAIVAAQQARHEAFGPMMLIAAVLLLERARHVRQDFYPQSILAGVLGMLAVIAFQPQRAPDWSQWVVQPSGIAMSLWLAWRVGHLDDDEGPHTGPGASRPFVLGASAILVTFFWHSLPAPLLGAAWATTGAAMALLSRRPAMLRGFDLSAAGLLLLAALRSLDSISRQGPLSATDVACVGVVIVVLLGSVLSRRGPSETPTIQQLRQIAGAALGTFLLTLLTFDTWRSGTVTVAWGAEGLLLLSAGFFFSARPLRIAGLAVLGLCLVKLFGYDLSSLEALPRILSFVGLGLVLLLVSWIYTRTARVKREERDEGH